MLEAILLGILQGLTEFLPISSSGHLVLVQSLMKGFEEPGLVFDVLLHAGTLLSVLVYFRRDIIDLAKGVFSGSDPEIRRRSRTMVSALIIATIPAAAAGILAEDYLEQLFQSPTFASFFLICTGLILCVGEFLKGRVLVEKDPVGQFNLKSYILVGMAQALALLPGISRSGSTIAAGMALGWSRTASARFSFLLMIPAVSGAVILKIPDAVTLMANHGFSAGVLMAGFTAAAVSGFLAIDLLLKLVKNRSLFPFAIYCIAAGSIVFVLIQAN